MSMASHTPRKRHTQRVLLLLLAGLTASILIAWSIEVLRARTEHSAYPRGDGGGSVDFYVSVDTSRQGFVLMRSRNRWLGCEEWFQFFDDHSGDVSGWPTGQKSPRWVPDPDRSNIQVVNGAVAYGFPWFCMKSGINPPSARLSTIRRAMVDYNSPLRWVDDKNHYYVFLPVTPLLPGLLLNTLFYATLFSTPYLLRQTRRHLRLRRGHCPFCNYDLRNDFSRPCSECGGAASVSPSLRSA